jgi:hypothetical protein
MLLGCLTGCGSDSMILLDVPFVSLSRLLKGLRYGQLLLYLGLANIGFWQV